ncbi:hypothetical protein M0804_006083 [Polistes exclamans]|nr:hypothetical protein M0804_006083 [Polistes exclamans]
MGDQRNERDRIQGTSWTEHGYASWDTILRLVRFGLVWFGLGEVSEIHGCISIGYGNGNGSIEEEKEEEEEEEEEGWVEGFDKHLLIIPSCSGSFNLKQVVILFNNEKFSNSVEYLSHSFDPDGIKPTTFTWFPSSNGTSMSNSRQTKSELITEGQFRTAATAATAVTAAAATVVAPAPAPHHHRSASR